MSRLPVVVVLAEEDVALARRIGAALTDASVHGLASRVVSADRSFEKVSDHLQSLFASGTPLIVVAAVGIIIRALAGRLSDKQNEPPVVAVSASGQSVIPLLGGHRGANDFARGIAETLNVKAAITTAGDERYHIALDSPPDGLTLHNPQHYRAFVASMIAGSSVQVPADNAWLNQAKLPLASDGDLKISVTHEVCQGTETHLVYNPKVLYVGVGCERGVSTDELEALVQSVFEEHRLAKQSVAGLFSIDVKADEYAVLSLAKKWGLQTRFFDAKRLERETPRLANPSDIVYREVGCHGVAEGAALAASGVDGQLIVTKKKSERATVAVALSPQPLATELSGRRRGRLWVVGIGPGDPQARTHEVETALRSSDVWVGYSLYLDLVDDLKTNQHIHSYSLGEETDRVKAAIALAADGRDVSLVCSGDAGIYAMAALVYEVMDAMPNAERAFVEPRVLPGVSALQTAAARAGAPIGHDFCAISLSDLLTPREVIRQRVRHAAEGDFVTAFYNPVSMKRKALFDESMDVLRNERPADTPVIIARSLGRLDESVSVTTLETIHSSQIDMLTIVLVGSSTSKALELEGVLSVYTPRGYANKKTDSAQNG